MTKRRKIILTVLAIGFAMGAGLCAWVAFSGNAYAETARRYIKQAVAVVSVRMRSEEKDGLPRGCTVTNYVDGAVSEDISIRSVYDSKRVYRGDGVTRLVNYPGGYQLDLPEDTELDFTLSNVYVEAESDLFLATISRERSPYIGLDDTLTAELSVLFPGETFEDGTDQYITYYQNRFLLSPDWQAANEITVTRTEFDATCGGCQRITAIAENPGEMEFDSRDYLYIRGEGNIYYRILFRYNSENRDAVNGIIEKAASSFYEFAPYGTAKSKTDYSPELPEYWTEETRQVYDEIASSDGVRWGVLTQDIYETGVNETIPALEEKLGHKFSVVLCYQHFNTEIDDTILQRNYDEGRLTEFTYQITTSNNLDLYGNSPLLDIVRGEDDETIRCLARKIAGFGHPVLFRLCNEMNSDWTSYGGIINLEDPRLFTDMWQRIYRIFREEGADNVIWIFNPNDNNYPPSNWNNYLAYYPGNGYAQMIGVTGYNTGTYYKDTWGEQWREFEDIYDAVEFAYKPIFGDFPWIITEFASSSVGGDKAAWVDSMFEAMPKYENIKVAVWFSCPDYDPREGHEGEVSRPYWIDETEEVTEAFRRGLADAPTGW